MHLSILDTLFYWFHVVIVIFNLFGWVFVVTRKLHFIIVTCTLFSWVVLGFKFGLGYCFLTDWHWQIKYKAGYTDLPNSFITYILNYQLGLSISPALIDICVGATFLFVVMVTFYVNRTWLLLPLNKFNKSI